MSTPKDSYRFDIDGLRAIAVLSVVLFHIDATWMPGGFVGVDVFFVISGYLITSNIRRELGDGRFSLADFYRRRIRRIMPVMLFVVAITLLVGQFVLLPEHLTKLAWSSIASVASGANIYFTYFLDTSYFASDARMEPLLHLWSLGVEEQFYLLWPFVFMTISRSKWVQAISLMTLILLSFWMAEWFLKTDPMFAYYMLPTRAGELLIGAFAACYASHWSTSQAGNEQRWQILGLALVALSLLLLTEHSRFPGLNAVPVSVGTALLLLNGAHSGPVSRVLSSSPFRFFGLSSYSMYLWHWPVLAYLIYLFGDLTLPMKLGSFALITALSYGSYRFVEVPCRQSQLRLPSLVSRQLLLPAGTISIAAGLMIFVGGYGVRGLDDSYRERIEAALTPHHSAQYVCQKRNIEPNDTEDIACVVNSTLEPDILLWGDSNAAHYVGALKAIGEKVGLGFRNVAHSACPPLLRNAERFVSDDRIRDCKQSSESVREILARYRVIILGGSWTRYQAVDDEFYEELAYSIRTLVQSGKQVLVLGKAPVFGLLDPNCSRKAINVPFLDCADRTTIPRDKVERAERPVKSLAHAAGALYWSPAESLCDEDSCSAMIEGYLAYRDTHHFNLSGSIALGKLAAASDVTQNVFRSLVTSNKTGCDSWQSARSASNWLSNEPIVRGENLIFEDSSRTRSSTFGVTLEGTGDTSSNKLCLNTVIAPTEQVSALFRLRFTDAGSQSPIDFDYLVNTTTGEVSTKRQAKPFFASVEVVGEELRLKIRQPNLPGTATLYVSPAATQPGSRGYSKVPTGTLPLSTLDWASD